MTFTTRNLTNDRVLVSGTDLDGNAGKVVLDARQWNELNKRDDLSKAQADYDEAVAAFFKPLTDAAEAAAKQVDTKVDGIGFVTIDEGEDATVGRPRRIVELTHDSIVLRLIEQGSTDRLIWVGDQLEVTESPVSTPVDPWAVADVEVNDDAV